MAGSLSAMFLVPLWPLDFSRGDAQGRHMATDENEEVAKRLSRGRLVHIEGAGHNDMFAHDDIDVIRNAMGAILDPSNNAGLTSKMIIDATRPATGFPKRHTVPPEAVARVQDLLRRLRDQGIAVVLITHKLGEALAVSDRVTILRRGRKVGEIGPEEIASAGRGATCSN